MFSLAYIDGTTGGLVVQLLLGGFVGGFVVFKLAAQSALDKIFRRKRVTDSEDGVDMADETNEKAA
jgi:hypothetical protein